MIEARINTKLLVVRQSESNLLNVCNIDLHIKMLNFKHDFLSISYAKIVNLDFVLQCKITTLL